MNSNKSFLERNKKIIYNFNTNKTVLIIDRGRYISAIYQSIYSGAINKKYKYNVKAIVKNKKKILPIYKSFGDIELYGSSILSSVKSIKLGIKGFFFILKNLKTLRKKNFDWFIHHFKISNINVGDLIYDTYIRYDHKYIKPKVDLSFLKIILSTYVKLNLIRNFITNEDIKFIIVGEDSYSSIGALAIRLGIKYNIKTIEPKHDHAYRQFFTEYNKYKIKYGAYNFYYRYLKNDKSILNNFKLNNKKFQTFFDDRFKGKLKLGYTGIIDLLYANQNLKKDISKKNLLKKLDLKNKKIDKIILVGFHAFSDAPHGQETDIIFRDYYAYAKETLQFLKKSKIKNTLFLAKPHPTRFFYNEHNLFENLYKEIIDEEDNIKICPIDINTKNLLSICDGVVTLKGTIAMEFACVGKPAVTCASTPFSKLNIMNEASTKKEYFDKIKKISLNNQKLTTHKKKKAQKVLYLLENILPDNYLGYSKIFDEKYLKRVMLDKEQNIEHFFNKDFIKKANRIEFLKDSHILKLLNKI